MSTIKILKDKASDILHRLEPIKYTIAAPLVLTGIYTTVSALSGVDYSQNAANALISFSCVGGGVYDAARYYKYRR